MMIGMCTILFEDPYWVAIFEKSDEDGYRATRFVFGALPNEAELHQFALQSFCKLSFSAPEKDQEPIYKQVNFKRRQREVHRLLAEQPLQKKAWKAIQDDYEQRKKEDRKISNAEKEAAKKERFLNRQAIKREKKRGH